MQILLKLFSLSLSVTLYPNPNAKRNTTWHVRSIHWHAFKWFFGIYFKMNFLFIHLNTRLTWVICYWRLRKFSGHHQLNWRVSEHGRVGWRIKLLLITRHKFDRIYNVHSNNNLSFPIATLSLRCILDGRINLILTLSRCF